MSAILLVWVFS